MWGEKGKDKYQRHICIGLQGILAPGRVPRWGGGQVLTALSGFSALVLDQILLCLEFLTSF